MAPRFAFQAHGRRGLGHLMRSMNIARDLLELEPEAEVFIHTRQPGYDDFLDERIQVIVDDGSESSSWSALLWRVRPHVAVHDTMLPAAARTLPPGVRCAFVLRARREELHDELDDHPFLRDVDLVIVPHTREDFGRALPTVIEDRAVFVGPIVRAPDPGVSDRLRDVYELRGAFVVVSTAGGGGFEETALPFYDAALRAHRRLRDLQLGRSLRHVLVLGPNSTADVEAVDGLTVVRSEPRLIDLLAIADIVVSEAGYNTVQELRLVGTPAVLVPGRRRLDDQEERAAAMETLGIAVVAGPEHPELVADAVVALATDDVRRRTMRAAAQRHPLVSGNREAAAHVLALAGVVV
jgi:predicted glycosyltransferase